MRTDITIPTNLVPTEVLAALAEAAAAVGDAELAGQLLSLVTRRVLQPACETRRCLPPPEHQ